MLRFKKYADYRRLMHSFLPLCISDGNDKMGRIGNVSLPPVLSCRKCGLPCVGVCYAINDYIQYTNCYDGWNRNWLVYEANPRKYFAQIERYLDEDVRKPFRFHVSGDIPDEKYFENMIRIANKYPWKRFLAFTKQYEIVNSVLDRIERPKNLNVIFSPWEGLEMPNPHNLPVARFIPMGLEHIIESDWHVCEGNCEACCAKEQGCFYSYEGYVVAMKEHGTPRTKAKKRKDKQNKKNRNRKVARKYN